MPRPLRLLTAFFLAATASLTVAAAQEATPEVTLGGTLPAVLQDAEGNTVAVALVAEVDDEISVGVTGAGFEPGEHGIHIHETGVCDPTTDPPFASAGGHYNPTEEEHGEHAGDLGNITAEDDGTATFQETTDAFELDELLDEDGSAIVIHAEEDENDPEGESFGARIACGVLAEPTAVADTDTTETVTETTTETATEAGTAVAAADSDGDGLTDDEEVNVHGTDPALVDSDEDGLGDGDEVNVHGTDPLAFDTDGDEVGDGDEVANGTDPLDPEST